MNFFNALKLVGNRKLILFVSVSLLTACQHVGKNTDDVSDKQANLEVWHTDILYFSQSSNVSKDQSEWRYSAKVGLTTASLKEQASLVWHSIEQSNVVRLFGPLGVGAIKLDFDQYGAQLSDHNGVTHQGANAQSLLTKLTGWPLPIDALEEWLFARPLLEQPFSYQLDDSGRISSIRQFGWQINYQDYRQYDAHLLPRRVVAVKQFTDPKQGKVTVKLVAKNWQ